MKKGDFEELIAVDDDLAILGLGRIVSKILNGDDDDNPNETIVVYFFISAFVDSHSLFFHCYWN